MKEYKVKGTPKQLKAIEGIVAGKSKQDAMIEAGYAPSTARVPKELTESKAYKERLKEYGLTEGLVTRALVEDIEDKRGNRKGELELGAKVLGMTKEQIEVKSIEYVITRGEAVDSPQESGEDTERQ